MENKSLNINITIEGLDKLGELKNNVIKDVRAGVEKLAASTHAKLLETATSDLPESLSQMYKDAVTFEEIERNVWVVSINEKVMWIEEGKQAGFMEYLLKGKSSKTAKAGHRYAVIPFKQDKTPSQVANNPKAAEILDILKKELRKHNVSYRKLELDEKGSPRIGKLYSFDIKSPKPSAAATYDALKGVSIYQKKNEKTGKVERSIMTFRVISEKHRGSGKWQHPGTKGYFLMDKVYKWAMDTWNNQIMPEILSKYNKDGGGSGGGGST